MEMPTKERILQAVKECPDSKAILKTLFPEVFHEGKRDITEELTFSPDRAHEETYWLDVHHGGIHLGYFGYSKFVLKPLAKREGYSFEQKRDAFCFYKEDVQ